MEKKSIRSVLNVSNKEYQELRRIWIKLDHIWQYKTYGPLIGPKTLKQYICSQQSQQTLDTKG